VTLGATDAGSGVEKIKYTLDGTDFTVKGAAAAITVPGQGPHTLSYYSVDRAGNVESSAKPITFKIDSIKPLSNAPSLTGSTATSGGIIWYTGAVGVTLSASDPVPGSGVDKIKYKLNGAATFENYTGTFSPSTLLQGVNKLMYYSTDIAGNGSEADVKSITVNVDTTAPTTTATPPALGASGWYTGPVTVALKASDINGSAAVSGVSQITYSVDGKAPIVFTGAATAVTVSGEGSHTVTFSSVDKAGNVESTKTSTFKIDSTKSVTTVSLAGTKTTSANIWYTSAVGVTLSATDPVSGDIPGSGVAQIKYTLDGVASDYTTPFSVSSPGIHNLKYWSVDKAGNIEVKRTIAVNVDSIPPVTTASLVGTKNAAGTAYITPVTVSLPATDAAPGSGGVKTYYTLTTTIGTVTSITTGQYSKPIKLSAKAKYSLSFYSIDAAGNIEVAAPGTTFTLV